MEGKIKSELSRSLEDQSSPWLVFFCKSPEGKEQQFFYSLTEERFCIKNISQTQDNIYLPTPQGWILTMNPHDNSCYLQDLITATKITLPRPTWNLKDCDCILSSSPTNPKCKVLVANNTRECEFLFCQPSDEQWTEYKYDLGNNPVDCITVLDEKFYGITRQGNFAMIDCPPNPGINILERINNEYSFGVDSFRTYIVQSCGELFCLKRFYDHTEKTVHISIMKRDSTKQEWFAVDSIGHRVFLLGDDSCSTVSCSSPELGIKGNCLYFVEDNDRCVHCFDLEEGFISVHLQCLKGELCQEATPAWMIPELQNKTFAELETL